MSKAQDDEYEYYSDSETDGLEPDIGKLHVNESHRLVQIFGVDRNLRGDLVFCCEIHGRKAPVFVSHLDMKKFFTRQLIDFYERFVQIGRQIDVCQYKPPVKVQCSS